MPAPVRPSWRLSFDVPHAYAVEPGFSRSSHAHDFRETPGSLVQTWREPLTGVLMLQPTFVNEGWHIPTNWLQLSAWMYDSAFWRQVQRGSTPGTSDSTARFFSSVAGGAFSGNGTHAAVIATTAIVSRASALTGDTLYWGLQLTGTVAEDESFSLHYHFIGDKLTRVQNLMYLQVGDVGFHIAGDGTMRAYQYRSGMGSAPTLMDEFTLCDPSELIGHDGYFLFLPIPNIGLIVSHSRTAQKLTNYSSSAQSSAARGHLVKFPTRNDGTNDYILSGGKAAVALSDLLSSGLSRLQYMVGFHTVEFPTSGTNTFLGEIFDPGYKPSVAPTSVEGIAFNGRGTVTADLRKTDDSGAWVAGTDQQGRVKLTLSTTDAKYTPMVGGTFARWLPVLNTRATTALPVSGKDRLFRLEFTEDDTARFEGRAVMMAKTDEMRAVVERGDTTFLVERCDNPHAMTPVWVTQGGGLARLTSATAQIDDSGFWYDTEWKLSDQWQRFGEITQTAQDAFDGLTVGGAIDKVLSLSGFPLMSSIPADALALNIPPVPDGQNWKFGTRPGETGDKILKEFLLFLRRQWVEYRLRYDWDAAGWVLEKKPRDTTGTADWIFSPHKEDENISGKTLLIAGDGSKMFDMGVTPPEVNVVQPFGLTTTDTKGEKVPGVTLYNYRSMDNPAHADYLGRCNVTQVMMGPLSDDEEADINRMGRRVYDAAAHRRIDLQVPCRWYADALKPATRVRVKAVDEEGDDLYLPLGSDPTASDGKTAYLWVKRRSVTLDYTGVGESAPGIIYALGPWESELDQ